MSMAPAFPLDRPYFHPAGLVESSMERQLRDQTPWTKFYSPYIKTELPSYPAWPPSPPGQDQFPSYYPYQMPPTPASRCAGLLTPSPCSSSDSSDKIYSNLFDTYASAVSRTFTPFPTNYSQPQDIWNPYNMNYSRSQTVETHSGLSLQRQSIGQINYSNFQAQFAPYSPQAESPTLILPNSRPPSEPQVSTTTTEEPRKSRRCRCPNCVSPSGSRIPASASKERKKHLCHIEGCGRIYGKTSHLKAHLRWHNGDRPFRCDYPLCGKSFTRSDELTRHVKTHTGDKRFKCPHCDKGFTRSDHLTKHIKVHLKGNILEVQPIKRGRKSTAYKLAMQTLKTENTDEAAAEELTEVIQLTIDTDDPLDMTREPSPYPTSTAADDDIQEQSEMRQNDSPTYNRSVSSNQYLFDTIAYPPNSFYFPQTFGRQEYSVNQLSYQSNNHQL